MIIKTHYKGDDFLIIKKIAASILAISLLFATCGCAERSELPGESVADTSLIQSVEASGINAEINGEIKTQKIIEFSIITAPNTDSIHASSSSTTTEFFMSNEPEDTTSIKSEEEYYYDYDISYYDGQANFDYSDPTEVKKHKELFIYSDDKNLSDIASNDSVEILNVCQTSSGDLIGIDNFGGLKEFNFYMYNVNIKDISDLEKVLTIQRVHMNYADSVEDFSPLGKLSNLKYLSVTSQTLPGIDEIKNCQNLETLKLENFLTVDLSFISDLKNLKELYLSEKNTYIEDISFLRGLTNLETLEITCGEKSEFSVITELRNLKTLKIYNSQITDEQIEILKNEMPWCEII